MDCDLVVLATGQVPNTGPDPYAQLMVEEAEDEETRAAAQKALEVAPPSILNLDYRQGTDLPHLKNGFVDSHFICFPYETRRTGIYAAGPVRRPMDMKQAVDDAVGATMKAIQSLENAAKGSGAHPRVGDLSYPTFRKEGCTQCKRCTVECPFGAINEDEKKYPQFNEARCRRCRTCMGACPVRVISFETTRWTRSASRSGPSTCPTSSPRSPASWRSPARTTPTRRWTWPRRWSGSRSTRWPSPTSSARRS
jgi:quinone-modifying oxidoreductase subunit QmoB